MSSKILIIHDGITSYLADIVVSNLKGYGLASTTLREVLVSGRAINIKEMVDNASAVIVLDGKAVLTDSIASAAIAYAKDSGKTVVPVESSYAGRTISSLDFFRAEMHPYQTIGYPVLPRDHDEFYREVIFALSPT